MNPNPPQAPFVFHSGTRPLLVSMPHAGTWVPSELAARLTAPTSPASAMTAASSSSFLALRTRHGAPTPRTSAASLSDSSTLAVPTRTGRPEDSPLPAGRT